MPEESASHSAECGPWQICAVITGVVCNLLSVAFVWPFNQIYDEAREISSTSEDETDLKGLSTGAAVLATLALFGLTVGLVLCFPFVKIGISLMRCECTDNNELCQGLGCLLVSPGVLWYILSCGVFQLIAGALMSISTFFNNRAGAGSNVVAFAGFTAAWEYLTALFSLLYGIAATKPLFESVTG